MCVFQCLGPSILIMDENNREFDQNGLDCFLLPRNQAIQTFEVPTSTGNFCTAASHSRFVYSEDLSVGCLRLRSPDCPCARLSAILRCSRPLPCAAKVPISLGWRRRRWRRRSSRRRLAPVRCPSLLNRRMEALPCIRTVVRRRALPFASSTHPVRSVGGELEGGVAPVRSLPPLGPRMEAPPLHLRSNSERWVMNRKQQVI